jgi:ataxia telangiectasia mutated family protein
VSRKQSSEWNEDVAILKAKEEQLQQSTRLLQNTKRISKESSDAAEIKYHHSVLEKEVQAARQTRDYLEHNIVQSLKQAVESFLLALQVAGTGTNDMSAHVFRMISLWFSSHAYVSMVQSTINDVMTSELCQIPSFRFVPLTNQLFSRIELCQEGKENEFQVLLQELVFKMCNDHPYHCLTPLMALSNGTVVGNMSGASTFLESTTVGLKVSAANDILSRLRKDGLPYVVSLVESYDALVKAYNSVAYAPVDHLVKQKKLKKIKFSELFKSSAPNLLDRCLKGFDSLPCVVTSPPELRPGKDYGSGSVAPIGGQTVAGFEAVFDLTDSGNRRPKIVVCIGSDGTRFRQLVKGNDDIRQDAIMSQVFTYVNKLLNRERGEKDGRASTDVKVDDVVGKLKRTKMKIATYNILPLSPNSGVSHSRSITAGGVTSVRSHVLFSLCVGA